MHGTLFDIIGLPGTPVVGAIHLPFGSAFAMMMARAQADMGWQPLEEGEFGSGTVAAEVVKRLRRKLDGDAADPRYTLQEPRVGYRMAVGETPEQE